MRPADCDTEERAIRDRAAEWYALCLARELTLNEHADLADWLAANPRHAEHFAELESAWKTFDRLAAWPHSADLPPDPDLLKRPPARRFLLWPLGLAAAAAIAVGSFVGLRSSAPPVAGAPAVSARVPQSPVMRLSDGSVVDLRGGAEVKEEFNAAERRVRLVRGEAHFIVMTNPARPFIVDASGVAVRAVGTAFNVRLAESSVEVLVTEGTVQVAPPVPLSGEVAAPVIATLTIGQRTIVSTVAAEAPAPPAVETVPIAEIDRLLAWQQCRFVFEETPLAEVVGRFNRQAAGRSNAPLLVIADPGLSATRISGRVRTDNIDDFVEVLESSFGVQADRTQPGKIIIRPSQRR